MADEVQYSSRTEHKRKFDDPAATPPASDHRRPSVFLSAPISAASSDNHASAGVAPPPASYNSVPPPVVGIELAKQRAQEIAAKLFNDAEAKRPKIENGAGNDSFNDYMQKPLGQQVPSYGGMTSAASFNSYGAYAEARKRIDVPNGRVGVIIGKGGETIKYFQIQSGCKIQVTRDADADPNSQSRTVELSGTSEQISKAEKLISDVLSEAEAGGSGVVTNRKFVGGQVGGEQFSMKVPNNKVGLIIGKGGETIKNMQANSGARIQIIPLHPPPGDTSLERTVYIDGTQEQIESAKQLVNEVISENRRNPQMGGGYSQQGYRPPTNWGPPGQPPMQQPAYGYMQPGAYPGQPPQYTQSPYGSYPSQPAASSGGYSSAGYDQSSNASTQQTTTPAAAGYDYYNQQQQPLVTSSAPADATNYNYGQPAAYGSQGSSYADASYSQASAGQQQAYGQETYPGGYNAQTGVAQPTQNAQTGYDQGYGYGGTAVNPAQDGSAPSQQGYATQPPTSAPVSYPSTQPGYSQTAAPLTQPGYGQSPQAQKLPAVQTQPAAYVNPGTAQTGYGQPPPSQPVYAQAYGGQQAPGYGGYGQQQQPYAADAYGSGGYPQPPVYSSEGGGTAPAVPGGVTKASPQS